MKSIYNLYEASILDIDANMKAGDDASRIMDYINFLVDSSKDSYKEHVNDIVAFCIKNNLFRAIGSSR